MKVALFITCLGDWYYPRMGIAAVKVLEHLGCTVTFPPGQTCCGQPMFNNGFPEQARALAARMVEVFAGSEFIVTPSGSCAAMVREHYAGLFEDAAQKRAAADLASRTYEFAEFLARVLRPDLRALGARWEGRATHHFSCHLRGLGLTTETTGLMGQIAGLVYTPLDRAEQCCGFGGAFATSYPEISGSMARDKAARSAATRAAAVVCGEPGCSMNLEGACRRAGPSPRFLSPAEVIAESLGLLPRDGG
jgi:L-lactate dehydrogenase complex protein LldE